MIAALVLAGVAVSDDTDFDAFAKAASACDRGAVTKTVAAASKHHAEFLVIAYKEQRAIATDRAALAERRRKLRAGEPGTDSEQALTLAAEALDDRTLTLADQRALDAAEQDMVTYFRSRYLTQCSGRPSS